MPIPEERKVEIESLALESLEVMGEVSSAAKSKINNAIQQSSASSLAGNINTWTDSSPIKNLDSIKQKNIDDFRTLEREPVIARIVVLTEDDEEKIYYISRTSPAPVDNVKAVFASYRSPVGRLASIPPGDDVSLTIGGKQTYLEVLERTQYHPQFKEQWDSVNNLVENHESGFITVDSFRIFLDEIKTPRETEDILSTLLRNEESSEIIFEGVRRNVIDRMSLRDQPILDKYQDEIFRLPLQKVLLIVGPPGTGKTTTLIRRLGQKLDSDFLPEEEQELLDRYQTKLPHKHSWIMFTPTELLKQYVKEAFNREGVPASEERIKTWDDYRRYLARNILGILKSTTGGGMLILNDSKSILTNAPIEDSISWYEEFSSYFRVQILSQLKSSNNWLIENVSNSDILNLAEKIDNILGDNRKEINVSVLRSLDRLKDTALKIIKIHQEDATSTIKKSLNYLLNTDKEFLDNLSTFINELKIDSVDSSEADENDEDDIEPDSLSKSTLTKDYNAAIRAIARAKARGKKLNPNTKNSKIITWLGDKVLSDEKLIELGKNLEIQANIRRLSNPIRLYINRVSSQYRIFRREQMKNGSRWYSKEKIIANHVSSLEVDVILLLSLKNINSVFGAYPVGEIENSPHLSYVQSIIGEYRNQVLIDEATDFSPIQLACMMELTNPKLRSFFACGDFNQRITLWGTQTKEQMHWVSSAFDIKSINISYRQSQQLNELAGMITDNTEGKTTELPDYTDNKSVSPVLVENMGNLDALTVWLKDRIDEIEYLVQSLPSIAIFVNKEQDVQPMAEMLNEKLIDNNIRVVSCPEGRVMGQDGDIRVFDVQHIKGLEFEAVFFVGVDMLADQMPTLFDKYLYVGITRAATYLGITCENDLPSKIEHTRRLFVDKWNN
jgi:DNA polymerase III delta prime subunit